MEKEQAVTQRKVLSSHLSGGPDEPLSVPGPINTSDLPNTKQGRKQREVPRVFLSIKMCLWPLQRCNRQVPFSNHDPETFKFEKNGSYSQSPQANFGIVP